MSPLHYFSTIGGRIFLVLLAGVIASASIALSLANLQRQSDLERISLERVTDRVVDYITLIEHTPEPLRSELISVGYPNLHPPRGFEVTSGMDNELAANISRALGVHVEAAIANAASCLPYPPSRSFYAEIRCWVIYVPLKNKSTLRLMTFSPKTDAFVLALPDALFLSILIIGVAVLTFIVSRMVSSPLRYLTVAATSIAGDLDCDPLPAAGPREVRQAIGAFNSMQEQLRNHVAERSQILASITHDLQTPITRLRLRLEKVDDSALRSRLIDDLAAMQTMIRQGLQYYRGNAIDEPFVALYLDSLLESVLEDNSDGGMPQQLLERSDCDIHARPSALRRCFANLIENALKYAGGVEVRAKRQGTQVIVEIRDHGPGIPNDQIDRALKPFVRLQGSAPDAHGGVGLGLAIAQNMASANHGRLKLENCLDGGLKVTVTLNVAEPFSPTAPMDKAWQMESGAA